jgi:hypothetical protein
MKGGSFRCEGGKRGLLFHDQLYGVMLITERNDPIDDVTMPAACSRLPILKTRGVAMVVLYQLGCPASTEQMEWIRQGYVRLF